MAYQQGYGGGYPPQGPPPPPDQYGQQQGYYGGPPGQYGQPPPGPYGQPPPAPYGQPPPGQYGQPPPAQYGSAQGYYGPPPGQYGQPPPQQGYGGGYPPQRGYGSYAPQPAPPSPGYDIHQVAHVDTSKEAEGLRSAMRGMGTRERELIQILTRVPDPLVMANLRKTYNTRFMKDLIRDLDSETSGHFCETLLALARGPLETDCRNLHAALEGAGTNEAMLNDILLARSNADMRAIKAEYQRMYKRSLDGDVAGDLSGKTATLFKMVLAGTRAEESTPIDPAQLAQDVTELHRATEGTKFGADQISVCQLLSSRSDGQIRAISHEYAKKYLKPLAKVLEKEFSGHMEAALLRMLGAAEDRALADARALEAAMAGIGTKDRLLLNRLVRAHWSRDHMGQVKGAYRHAFGKDLLARVKGETSGDFEKVLVALIG